MSYILRSFGLGVGWMDLFGSICFQILLVYMIKRLPANECEGHKYKKYTYWFYLVLLNVWIVVTVLMMYGIISLQAQYIYPWLVWCSIGFIIDVIYMVWWCAELILGDSIEAITNIFISAVTMAMEMVFICVIYSIYNDIKQDTFEQN